MIAHIMMLANPLFYQQYPVGANNHSPNNHSPNNHSPNNHSWNGTRANNDSPLRVINNE